MSTSSTFENADQEQAAVGSARVPLHPSALSDMGAQTRPQTGSRAVSPANKSNPAALMVAAAAVLGAISFGLMLASHHIADGDLWAKLSLGAHVWKYGALPHHDLFAFTPVLPKYVDHEWGAGAIFFGLLKFFGPSSLMWLKIILASGALTTALITGRRAGCDWISLLFLAVPSGACVVLGYVPVVRSHAFTYFFFAVTLLCLEEIAATTGRQRLSESSLPAFGLPRIWVGLILVGIMLLWVNVHGGFVAGLGTVLLYTALTVFHEFLVQFRSPLQLRKAIPLTQPSPKGRGRTLGSLREISACSELSRPGEGCSLSLWERVRVRGILHSPRSRILFAVAIGSLLVTCINPYGPKFWYYLLPAVLAKRPLITEWQPLPLFAHDAFTPFRILFAIVLLSILVGWKNTKQKSWSGLMMLCVTALLAWRSRRHAPFFGIAALCFAGPFVANTLQRIAGLWCRPERRRDYEVPFPSPQLSPFRRGGSNSRLQELSENEASPSGSEPFSLSFGERAGVRRNCSRSSHFSPKWTLSFSLFALYSFVAFYAATHWLPDASFQVLAPVGHDPVREVDILSLAQVKGNLATPFHWGSYCAWRLYPHIKISMDGRYEAAFPESTFQLNAKFYNKAGADWDRLIREFPVDFVLLDLTQPGLRPEDLATRGYSLVCVTKNCSALMASDRHAGPLRKMADSLPPATINPLDATIPGRWWAATHTE